MSSLTPETNGLALSQRAPPPGSASQSSRTFCHGSRTVHQLREIYRRVDEALDLDPGTLRVHRASRDSVGVSDRTDSLTATIVVYSPLYMKDEITFAGRSLTDGHGYRHTFNLHRDWWTAAHTASAAVTSRLIDKGKAKGQYSTFRAVVDDLSGLTRKKVGEIAEWILKGEVDFHGDAAPVSDVLSRPLTSAAFVVEDSCQAELCMILDSASKWVSVCEEQKPEVGEAVNGLMRE